MKTRITLLLIIVFLATSIHAQENPFADTLDNVTISSQKQHYLQDVVGTSLFAGKKTDVISITGDPNLAQNNARTLFAKIPGINSWDMDGGGTQLNIGTRGTDAHRSIEMNMRQNGYNTNSDIFGYPENHFTIPMQAVGQVQLVRGSGALQFGPQFGGMMNYVMKDADTTKVFALESEQTRGSFNFFNSFNAIGGKKGKVSYYTFYDSRHGDGWRPNSAFNYQTVYANIKFQFSKNGNIAFQFSRMDYRQQIAGGLTDAMFNANARQSNRSRNYFSPKINIPAVVLDYKFSNRTKLNITANGLWGERSSVQFVNTANINDTINTNTNTFNPRQVDRDYYDRIALEARLLHHYKLGTLKSTLAAGLTLSNSHTRRKQKGKGTTASDFDFTLISPYGVDLHLHTFNYAVFLEDILYITEKFSVSPGVRYEVINSNMDGVINNAAFNVAYKGDRKFLLAGIGAQYQVSAYTQIYGNVSQAYRPYLYANITPSEQVGVIDPNMKDSKGYDVDLGYRGQVSNVLTFDLNAFYLYYGNKIGKLTIDGNTPSQHFLTTNIGNSIAKGFEAYVNLSLTKLFTGTVGKSNTNVFSSMGYTHARYSDAQLGTGDGKSNIDLSGKRVENTPDWNEKAGLEFSTKNFSSTLQFTHISKQYNDANNTAFNATGLTGQIPSYTLWDWSVRYSFLKHYKISGGINNLTNGRYFSRRINMYPGPGILPGDGRSFYVCLGLKI